MEAHARFKPRIAIRERLGGVEGNELLTASVAAVLVGLLAAEGLTLLDLNQLLSVHMFLGLVLIPPILLKLCSTGYRLVRYHAGSRPYREKGPPILPLRLLAPALVLTTLGVFTTGVWLLLLGHKSDQVLFFHQAFVIGWVGIFAIHFLAHAPRALRSLRSARRQNSPGLPGSGLRGMLVGLSVGAGLALALGLLDPIADWHMGIG